MKTSNIKLLRILILFVCLLGNNLVFSQRNVLDTTAILGYWVRYNGHRQDTLVYIPFSSPLSEHVSSELRYSGIHFKDHGTCLQYRWKMCGNDDGPDFYPGTWHLSAENNMYFLSINVAKTESTYRILQLFPDRMVFVPVQRD